MRILLISQVSISFYPVNPPNASVLHPSSPKEKGALKAPCFYNSGYLLGVSIFSCFFFFVGPYNGFYQAVAYHIFFIEFYMGDAIYVL